MAWPTKKAAKLDTSPTKKVAPAKTAALAARTAFRWGTATKVERTEPVLYSAVTMSTPSTAMASWARKIPFRLNVTG